MNVYLREAENAVHGVVNINDATNTPGDFYCVECLTDTVFQTFTENAATGSVSVSATFPAGTRFINGNGITVVRLTSGNVRCYVRKPTGG